MRNLSILSAFGLAMLVSSGTQAFNLKIHGVVTEYLTGQPMTDAVVRVYKDGVKESNEETGAFGLYGHTLKNNALYVIRFSAPGFQTKCFTIDTHGLEWEGAHKVKELFVEMTLFRRISDMDLSFFDLPMGQAHFEPATGLVNWDTEYDLRIREEVQGLMSQYEQRSLSMADATSSIKREGTVHRKHSGAAR
jgi:hypothetical protein